MQEITEQMGGTGLTPLELLAFRSVAAQNSSASVSAAVSRGHEDSWRALC